ncbi:uncharacterized protein ARB_04141 [Trichophyton benhamiae CBS 112371]|uniref:Uncharacterized protein n=1 Tax=Arthroderma benhamiae (strain ATCC MYA-4681 / CBS 112371) TaxID=663331 RepID=D4AIP5_ARTBC|nr:uncharacterized protein ARB_04141 [Trichophyton benhamiae CBS 112371]EFE36618.1 hypothetical protein ARB_04141 [Trichophyton benhamiae CBS 112371]
MKFFAVLFLIPFLGGALAAPSPSEMIAEAPMQENSDMDASSQLLSVTAAQCPPSHPLYCRAYNFCCVRQAVSCCPRACCARGTTHCGSDGHCYRRG